MRRRQHWMDVKEERRKYLEMIELAKKHPNDYLCIVIDGMDQAKTDCPRCSGTREKEDCPQMHTRVIGVLVHGRFYQVYVCPPNVPHDSNTTLTCIVKVLSMIQKDLGKFPKNLHIQMDNTSADNKTRMILSMGQRLVECGLFWRVTFGFLPVGHTHCDIDQSFSVIAQYLKRHPVDTIEQLVAACKAAFSGRRSGAELLQRQDIIDFRRFLSSTSEANILEGFSAVHGSCLPLT